MTRNPLHAAIREYRRVQSCKPLLALYIKEHSYALQAPRVCTNYHIRKVLYHESSFILTDNLSPVVTSFQYVVYRCQSDTFKNVFHSLSYLFFPFTAKAIRVDPEPLTVAPTAPAFRQLPRLPLRRELRAIDKACAVYPEDPYATNHNASR